MCNPALVFFITKATVSAPCEPCMSCRLVCLLLQSCYMYFYSTNKMDGWISPELIDIGVRYHQDIIDRKTALQTTLLLYMLSYFGELLSTNGEK